jgi:hypothetical protein
MLRSNTTVDAIFERDDRALPRAVLRKLPPNARQRHCIWLASSLQMAILAGKIVAGEPSGWVGHPWTDLIRRVGEKRVPIFDKSAERIVRNGSDVGGNPLAEINVNPLRGRQTGARNQGEDGQCRGERDEPRAFHIAPINSLDKSGP